MSGAGLVVGDLALVLAVLLMVAWFAVWPPMGGRVAFAGAVAGVAARVRGAGRGLVDGLVFQVRNAVEGLHADGGNSSHEAGERKWFLRRAYEWYVSLLGPFGFLCHWVLLFCPDIVYNVLLHIAHPFWFQMVTGPDIIMSVCIFMLMLTLVMHTYQAKDVRFWDVRVFFVRERKNALNIEKIRKMHKSEFFWILFLFCFSVFGWQNVFYVIGNYYLR